MMNDDMKALAAFPLQLTPSSTVCTGDIAAANSVNGVKREDRIPQWGNQETKDFIAIRAELENDFTQKKRNKTLWVVISSKMRERGYRRSADQCKCKWKNLVNRYKMGAALQGKETSEVDNARQCPFFEELHTIFTERSKNMDMLLLESELGTGRKKKPRLGDRSSEDDSEEDDDDDDESEDERIAKKKKRKTEKEQERQRATADRPRANSMQEVLEDFFQQQQRIEIQWREAFERREHERRLREREWREAMENLEKERILREQIWRDREERRRSREEARAEKRDALFTALLSRLSREEM